MKEDVEKYVTVNFLLESHIQRCHTFIRLIGGLKDLKISVLYKVMVI